MVASAKLFILSCIVVFCKGIDIRSLKLEQILILSRHNIRTPLTGDLDKYSSREWPKWNNTAGDLTHKGAQLEQYMGEYIAEWLDNEEFIEGCPEPDEVLIYANTKPRTLDSAKAFADSAFRTCNISVHHHENLSIFDPIFFPIFHNNTEAFMKQVTKEMTDKLNELNLSNSYEELSRILNIQDSEICKKLFMCDLISFKSEVAYEDGEEPNVSGPLYVGNAIVDSFIMSYYEGMPIDDVGWGQIITDDQWNLLTKITKENQNVRFNLTTGAKDIAGPLLRYMFDIFEEKIPKFTLLMGHDSNLNPVIRALGIKPFVLPDQFEPFPIGGKLVFQKWVDNKNTYLKLEYIYPTVMQLRYGYRMSLLQPPQRVTLELQNCISDSNGYCPWDDFMKLNTFK